jgi:hypothetical protein
VRHGGVRGQIEGKLWVARIYRRAYYGSQRSYKKTLTNQVLQHEKFLALEDSEANVKPY